MGHVFVGLPDPSRPKNTKKKRYTKISLCNAAGTPQRQVLWGDWLSLAEPEDIPAGEKNTDTWLWVRWAWSSSDPEQRKVYKIRREYTTTTRPLEIIFVDVGQGDGCVLITPERGAAGDASVAGQPGDGSADGDEKIIVIDAGKYSHMADFLDGRFKAYRKGFNFHAAIITHPDHDHYRGFGYLFKRKKISFDVVYHNGIAEFNGSDTLDRLGGIRTDAATSVDYLQRLITTHDQMRAAFFPKPAEAKSYGTLIEDGFENGNVGRYEMLGLNMPGQQDERAWLPGFGPDAARGYTIEVLGPWFEYPFAADEPTLRTFENDLGKTKNGQSILLRLEFGPIKVFFGGDLNSSSEKFLLQKFGGVDGWPLTDEAKARAGDRLKADVMKSCHHGSADVTDEFIEAVNPAAFVISSGDQDANYVHPRPDLLGRLGRLGKGDSPVLLSTELQRSTREIDTAKDVAAARKKVERLAKCTAADHGADDFEEKRAAELSSVLDKLSSLAVRSVAVDGAIYIKTDGHHLMAAFKKETTDAKNKWFYYMYQLGGDGEFELEPREGGH